MFQPSLSAYAVLSHEAIIDTVWSTDLVPLLKKRFPKATPDDLREAHAYAYGGAIIQDMGFYPYGSKFFSDLTHYVRSGDFVLSLLRNAHDLNEFAFALGSLSHYAADNDGHSIAVNRAVPVLYPELRKKYGDSVTYEDDPVAHVKTEFGFDVLEVAKGRFAPDAYRDFIGFEVAQPLLERAFAETYGLELSSVLKNENKAIGSYRHDVSKIIPEASKVAWQYKKKDIERDEPGITRRKFLYNLSRTSYEKQWGRDYQQPGFKEKFLAFLFRLVPKFGPLKVIAFRVPKPETEKMFEASFNASVDSYRKKLQAVAAGDLRLDNDNLDVGKDTGPGQYRLTDDAYGELVHRLAADHFSGLTPALQKDIEHFYAMQSAPAASKRKRGQDERLKSDLAQLRAAQP